MPDTIVITTHSLEPAVRLKEAFQRTGYRVELLTATERIADVQDPVLVVLTGALTERRARRLAREAAELDHLPVIGLADVPSDATPESRRRLGLAEAFIKPYAFDEIALVGHRIVGRRRLQRSTGIVGETAAIHEALERVVQVAPVHSTVLVTGESGTGKELIARGIHALSPRRHRPFIAANVAALAETLLESELFGHEKGAFTGAIAQRKGLFELADRGTLFLDEIGEMPLSTQTKLLRVLEEREFMRVGGETPIRVDVRVIAATNQDLRHHVEIGHFRRDLYYRLNVLRIELPALRDRRQDVPLLIHGFVRQTATEHDLPMVTIAPETLDILVRYNWPGNVRELRNLIESMVVLAHGRMIRPEDIPAEVRLGSSSPNLLPAPLPYAARRDGERSGPEVEFIFRTMLQLRVEIEDLRRDFDTFRRSLSELPVPATAAGPFVLPRGSASSAFPTGIEVASVPPSPAPIDVDEDEPDDSGIVVFRPGKTMSDLEREAIVAALAEVGGNRRKAAEMLGIGERTLYRKIREYHIPV